MDSGQLTAASTRTIEFLVTGLYAARKCVHRVIFALLAAETSPLRHPGHPHALIRALTPREVGRMAAGHLRAIAADGKAGIER
jgi:hypothetical protein